MRKIFCVRAAAVLCAATLAVMGCSSNPTPESGAVVGGVSGGAVGAIVGHDLGNTGAGTVIGAATGAGVGAVVGSQNNDKQQIIEKQQDIIANQQKEIRRQGNDLTQIKRQQYWDERLKQHQ